MKLTAQETQWMQDWFGEALYHWGGPCDDEAYFVMEQEDAEEANMKYFNAIVEDDELFSKEWGDEIREFIDDFHTKFNTVIEQEFAISLFIGELMHFLFHEF